MSMTLTMPSLRFVVASTGVPFHSQVMPEPRCGRPGRSTVAILRRTLRLHHLALARLARRADQVIVVLVEEEVVEHVVEQDAARTGNGPGAATPSP